MTEKLTTSSLTTQLKDDYLAYSMAVLIGRAIPSLTDGMKPAQRRVLTAMKWLGLKPDGKYMKSARVEGETMGKLHPHGGAYGVMVTLAAPWNNNLPLIEGQGNWGSSVDGAAASRYTEAKLSPFSWDCLLSDSETWQTTDNYDGSLKEPVELNVKVPTVLLNGQDGIGVGFATRIPPHSLRDICDAVVRGTPLIPSFPSGCDVVRDDGLASYIETGIGTLRLRARCETTQREKQGRKQAKTVYTFTNLPHGTNPEKIGEQIAAALEKGTIANVTEVIDESDLSGDRVTVIAKAGTDSVALLRQLYHYTDLDSKYSARTLVIDGVKPVELSPSALIAKWKAWRLDRLRVQFVHEADAKEARLELVRGYLKAIDKIDAVIKVIRGSKTPSEAIETLVSSRSFKFTPDQAKAILDMRLRSLTNLDSEELLAEQTSLVARLAELDTLISSEKERTTHMMKDIKAIGVRYGEKRRSEVIDPPDSLRVEKGPRTVQTVSKPRYLKVDSEKGLVTQVKGPRGALVLEKTDKLVTLTQDGMLRKLPSSYKGPLTSGYSPVLLARKESDVSSRRYLIVFTLEGLLKAMVVSGEDLARVTSKGKSIVPSEATIVHFGEGSYAVKWASSRKKPLTLDLSTKAGKPGGKGVKVATVEEVTL